MYYLILFTELYATIYIYIYNNYLEHESLMLLYIKIHILILVHIDRYCK